MNESDTVLPAASVDVEEVFVAYPCCETETEYASKMAE